MAETIGVKVYSDLDIYAGIQGIMQDSYPPLMHDRHRIKVEVNNGDVILSGHVKVPQTANYLLRHVQAVPGVKAVDVQAIYNDEAIRLDVGQVVPPGIQIVVEYGAVVLVGELPVGVEAEALVKTVAKVAGVHRVLTDLR